MKKFLKNISSVIYAIIFPVFCVSASFGPYFKKYFFGYFGPHEFSFDFVRYIVIIVLIFILTFINRTKLKLFNVFLPAGIILVTVCAYADYFYFQKVIYNFSYAIWLLASASVACSALYMSAVAFVKNGFKTFNKRFWTAYTLIYILILYISFIRPANSFNFSVNYIPGNGTIKYFSYIIKNPQDGYMVLICIGNIFIFMPFSFVLKNLSNRLNDKIILIIGLIAPIFVEGYQYLFKCGNVDVDDVILNWSGFIIGLIIMKAIYKNKLSTSKTKSIV